MAVIISVVGGRAVVETHRLGAVNNAVSRINSVQGARYVLADTLGGGAVAGVVVTRLGKDLAIAQGPGAAEQETLIIEDFYGSTGQLVTQSADGQYQSCLVNTEGGAVDANDLADGASALLTLTAAPLAVAAADFRFTEGNGSLLGGALASAAAIAGGVVLTTEKNSGGKGTATPAATGLVMDDQAANGSSGVAVAMAAESAAGSVVQAHVGVVEDETAAQNASSVLVAHAGMAGYADNRVPVISGMIDDHGDITGQIANGGYTDDGRPQIIGMAEPGVMVHVYRGVELIGHSVADVNGNWSFVPRYPFADGMHSITVIHEYPNGDTSEESDPYVIVVDRINPDPPSITAMIDDEGRITGAISDKMVTDDPRPVINGTAEPNATVVIYDKGREVDRVQVGADGQWSFTPSAPLDDGLHIFDYAAVDRAGNISEHSALTEFVVDTRSEKVSIYFAEDNVGSVTGDLFSGSTTDDSSPKLFGSATAGGIVKIYQGQVLLGQTLADVDGSWEFTPPLALGEGAHTFHATVSLPAKGESERSKPFNLTVKFMPPEKPTIDQVLDDVGPVTKPLKNGDVTDDNKPTLLGKGEPNATLNVYDGNKLLGSVLVDGKGDWEFTPSSPLADGVHKFSAEVVDASGKASEKSNAITVTVDTMISVYKPLAVDLNGGAPQGLTQCYMIKTGAAPTQTYRIYVNGKFQEEVTLGSYANWNSRIWWTNATTQVFRLVVVKAGLEIEVDSHTGTQLMSKTSGPDGHIMLNNQIVSVQPKSLFASAALEVGDEAGTVATAALAEDNSAAAAPGVVAENQGGSVDVTELAGKDDSAEQAVGAGSAVPPSASEQQAAQGLTAGGAPAIDTMIDDHGAITGAIANGGYTDDGRPQIIGKAEPGVMVHVYRGVELIGHSVADANGNWSFVPKYPFADGTHSITIIHEYPNGDTSEESDPYVIVVDRIIPDPPAILGMSDDEGRITGAITDQMITDDNQPTVDGTGEPNSTLIVFDKGREIDRIQVAADGTWSYTPSLPLADGYHALSYAAVDRAGNASERSAVSEFVVDTRPEKINIYYADDNVGDKTGEVFSGGITDDATPMLFGSATAGGLVKIYEGDVLVGQTTAGVDGIWEFTPGLALSEGAHTFHATVTLPAKGESERSKPFNLTVDITPPATPSIDEVNDNVGVQLGLLANGQLTDDDTPTLVGRAEPGSIVHIYDDGALLGSAVTDAGGNWAYTPGMPLLDDTHSFTVKATDEAGNVSEPSDTFVIVIDSTRPLQPTIDSVYDDAGSKTGDLAMGEDTDDYRPDISGGAEAGSTVIVKDGGKEIGRVQADAQGKWSFTPETNLAEGGHQLTVESMDEAGNISLPSDRFDFSVAVNGDDHTRVLGGTAKINTTLVIDTSGSMAGTSITSVQSALKLLASEYIGVAAGEPITLTMLTMTNTTPVKYTFSSMADADYTKFIAAVNGLAGSGGPSYEDAILSAMNSIKADYLANNGPSQVFILGDAQNGLTQATADKWQSMLLNPTGSGVPGVPIQSTPISFAPFQAGYEHSFHWVATGGKAIDMPSPQMLPEILLGSAFADVVAGNLLENDSKLTLDGNEYITQLTFEGGTFRIAANNSLVMSNVAANVKGAYDPVSGVLAITTESGTLRVYMYASAGHKAGDYSYGSKAIQLYHGESQKEETFGYMAVDTKGMSQTADLYIVLQPTDATNLLKISKLGKDSGPVGDFVTSDGSAGRELSGTLSQQLAAGLKVQVSVDGGKTWQDAVTHGKNWTFIDMSAHSSNWTVQVRVSDGVTHGTKVLSQEVMLIDAPAAPVITSIPEAGNIYTSTLAQNGSEMTISLTGTGAKVGDAVHIQWGISTYDQVLTAVNIANGSVTLNVPAAVTYSTASYSYDFAVTAQIIGQDGAIGEISKPYEVVVAYARALVNDALQLAPEGNVYTGNGVTVTTTGTMAKMAQTASSLAGLTVSDSLQAKATFTLTKPADHIALRLSGADNALGAKISVYDVQGSLMFEQTVFGDTSARHLATFSWTKSGLVDIGSFTVTAMSASVTLDSFSQYVVTHTKETRDPNLIDVLTETFYGSGGSDVVSMSQYAQSYFAQTTAAVHGGSGIDTLKLAGYNHLLDMTTAGSKISSMEVIDLTGTGNNTLTLNLSDVLRNGGTDLFYTGDKSRVQMMVTGNAGDSVSLSDLLTGGAIMVTGCRRRWS